jgi:hypothetical protein
MRINPGLAIILERVVPESGFTLLDGRFIPAGTHICIIPAIATRDFEMFDSDTGESNLDC